MEEKVQWRAHNGLKSHPLNPWGDGLPESFNLGAGPPQMEEYDSLSATPPAATIRCLEHLS